MKKIPISAIVVGINESRHLYKCLDSLRFCEEIIYVDLGSLDESKTIAKAFTNIIIDKPIAPSGEYIQSEIVSSTKFDWILFIDPDENLDLQLQIEIISLFKSLNLNNEIGAVTVPWLFYFKNKKINGTIWGDNNTKTIIANKNRFEFNPITHYGRRVKDSFAVFEIKLNSNKNNVLHHYWMTSYRQFISKHLRYLKREGVDRYNNNQRINLLRLFKTPFSAFKYSFLTKKGYLDGLLGLFLSFFWVFYETTSSLKLFVYQLYNCHQKNNFIYKKKLP